MKRRTRKATGEEKRQLWQRIAGIQSARQLGKRVAYWQRLPSDESAALENLRFAWALIEHDYGPDLVRAQRQGVRNPLEDLFFSVELGFYPPPEVLFALHDAFDVYKAARGAISLEEAFFGPVGRGERPYAARQASKVQKVVYSFELHELIKAGEAKNKDEAAELLSARLDGFPSYETLKRHTRLPKLRKSRGGRKVNSTSTRGKSGH